MSIYIFNPASLTSMAHTRYTNDILKYGPNKPKITLNNGSAKRLLLVHTSLYDVTVANVNLIELYTTGSQSNCLTRVVMVRV